MILKNSQAVISLTHGTWRVGRDPKKVDVLLPGICTSRQHCLLKVWAGGASVEDLESRNGTYVNGTNIGPGGVSELRDTDELRIGDHTFQIQIPIPAEQTLFVLAD